MLIYAYKIYHIPSAQWFLLGLPYEYDKISEIPTAIFSDCHMAHRMPTISGVFRMTPGSLSPFSWMCPQCIDCVVSKGLIHTSEILLFRACIDWPPLVYYNGINMVRQAFGIKDLDWIELPYE